jgi:hypothetical protein
MMKKSAGSALAAQKSAGSALAAGSQRGQTLRLSEFTVNAEAIECRPFPNFQPGAGARPG